MRKGFTLIELLVVVLIIGILSAVALPQYQKAVLKARATEGITLLRNLEKAEQTYFMANGRYTADLDALDIKVPKFICTHNSYCQIRTDKSMIWELTFGPEYVSFGMYCLASDEASRQGCESVGVFSHGSTVRYYRIERL